MYVKVTDFGPEIYDIGRLRVDYPETLFPYVLSDELLAEYSIYPLLPTPQPEIDYTKNVEAGTPVFANGNWEQTWIVVDATEEQKTQRLDDAWTALRNERNRKLYACDWTQLPDSPVNKEEWAVYRQALRDITVTTTDPFHPVWPTEP